MYSCPNPYPQLEALSAFAMAFAAGSLLTVVLSHYIASIRHQRP